MQDCIFCQIVKKEKPCYKIYENEKFFAFLDIFPSTPGHTLVIPKKHYLWVYDVPEFDRYWLTVLKITKAIQKALKPKFVSYFTFGLQVPHAHIHIIPRYGIEGGFLPKQSEGKKEQLEKISKKIRRSFL